MKTPTYGIDTIWAEVRETIPCGRNRVRRLMKDMGIRSVRKKRFRVSTTDSKHKLPVSDNLLKQDFNAEAPNQVWVSDISYIPTNEGFLYLASIKDIFTKEIVGHACSDLINKELTIMALKAALHKNKDVKGMIHHSDRGSQYCAKAYQDILRAHKIKGSMSSKGNPYDNAPAESFFSTIKCELVHLRRFKTRKEATLAIFEYIEGFYNRRRRHSRLGYISPYKFKEIYYEEKRMRDLAI